MGVVCSVTLLAQQAGLLSGSVGPAVRLGAFLACVPLMWRSLGGLRLLEPLRSVLVGAQLPELLLRLLSVSAVFEVSQAVARVVVGVPDGPDLVTHAGVNLCLLCCAFLACEPEPVRVGRAG